MSTLATSYTSSRPTRTYVNHLGATARAFLAALIAVKPYQEMARKDAGLATTAAGPRAKTTTRAQDVAEVYFQADRYEASMPNLSAELRFLASRG
ncbi:hypothetical protein AAKU55_004088 [Oxalobacteraceae bacterium GrIS 1.11]